MGAGSVVLECCCTDVSVMQSEFPVREGDGGRTERERQGERL